MRFTPTADRRRDGVDFPFEGKRVRTTLVHVADLVKDDEIGSGDIFKHCLRRMFPARVCCAP